MHNVNCKCVHHWVAKILVVLAWVSAVVYCWAAWRSVLVWNIDATQWFYHVVVFVLLAFSMKFCGCCWKRKMMNGASCVCSCGSCQGGVCGGKHNEGHQHA